jgi:hypothetical protein
MNSVLAAGRRLRLPPRLLVCTALWSAGCGVFEDPATALVNCINRGAERMRSAEGEEVRVRCEPGDGRIVTVFVQPESSGRLTDGEVEDLLSRGVPGDALFYSGPDAPSIGQRALPRPGVAVSVYDGSHDDNRKYSDAYALRADIAIPRRFVSTGTEFLVTLRREPAGGIQLVDLR